MSDPEERLVEYPVAPRAGELVGRHVSYQLFVYSKSRGFGGRV